MRVVCFYFTSPSEIEGFAESLYRLSSKIGIRGNEAVFLEIEKSLGIFTEEGILARARALAKRFGLDPATAIARDPSQAFVLAKWGKKNSVLKSEWDLCPIDAIADFVSPFRRDLEFEVKLRNRLLPSLEFLGIRTLRDFLDFSEEALTQRFGSIASDVKKKARFPEEISWESFEVPEVIFENEYLSDIQTGQNCWELEQVQFYLKSIFDRMFARSRARGMRVSALQLELQLEKRQSESLHVRSEGPRKVPLRKWELDFPVPQGTSIGLLPIVLDRLRFDLGREPLLAPVEEIRVSVSEMTPGYSVQKDFFHSSDEQSEKWEALVGRLCGKLGKERTYMVELKDRYLPERSWTKVSPVEQRNSKSVLTGSVKPFVKPFDQSTLKLVNQTEGNVLLDSYSMENSKFDSSGLDPPVSEPLRPLRLLKKPHFLSRVSRSNEDLLIEMSHYKRKWKVKQWLGPERISGEWWLDQNRNGFFRDYYRVLTEEGEQLWVYLDGRSACFYLHGYFD